MKDRGAPRLRGRRGQAFRPQGPAEPPRRGLALHGPARRRCAKPAPLAGARAAHRRCPARMTPCVSCTLDGEFRPDLSDLAALPDGVTVQSLREALAQGAPGIMALIASADVQTDDADRLAQRRADAGRRVLRIAAGAALERDDRTGDPRLRRRRRSRASRARSSSWARRQSDHRRNGRRARRRGRAGQSGADPASRDRRDARSRHPRHGPERRAGARHVSLLAHLDADAALNSFALLEGAGLLRRQIFARLDGEKARVTLNGATLGARHASMPTRPSSSITRCRMAKAASGSATFSTSRATGVFQGKIVVRPRCAEDRRRRCSPRRCCSRTAPR